MPPTRAARTGLLTALAMVAFAANSLLCRAALGGSRIDAVSFTAVRLVSGAVVLALLARLRGSATVRGHGSWPSAAALAGYALAFSWAYTRIPAGVGALVLFGAVQITMVSHALALGTRPRPGEWAGFALALVGLVVLTRPGLLAPDPLGLVLMAVAGAAWGLYTIRGRGAADPLGITAGNFACGSVPAVLALTLAWPVATVHATGAGLALAMASGVVASGLGYAIWYTALRTLSTTTAAIVQLSAPLLAAVGGVVLLGEVLTSRLLVAAPLLLGGIALAVVVRAKAVSAA